MENKDILVVQLKVHMESDMYNKLANDILEQMKYGLVILPYYCESFLIPANSNLEIKKMEEPK